jgi:HEAT repeat protein
MIEYFFSSKPSVAKITESFRLWGRLNREGVMRLANVLKRFLTEPLLDALAEEPDTFTRRFFLSVLVGFRGDVLPHAARRLQDERWYVVRNMIYLLRECGGAHYVSTIRPFAKHQDRRVGMEAVKTLFHFNAPGAFPYLRIYLQSKDLALRDLAVKLAGNSRVREAVPYLIQLLEKRGFLGTELEHKASIIKALGEIGDLRAVESLERLYSAKSLLFRGAMEEIRVEIFRNLQNYPPPSVRPLVEKGLKSGNKEIKAISQELVSRKGK